MEKAVARGVGFNAFERGAFGFGIVKQLADEVGRLAQRLTGFGVALGQHGAAGANKAQRPRQQVELGRNGVFPQRLGLLDLFGGGVAHRVQLVHDRAQVVKTGAQVFNEQVVLLYFNRVVGHEILHARAHQRIAVLHMVLNERQRRAKDKTVHPQRQPRQLHGKRVQVNTENAALEQGALQDLRVFGHVVEVQKPQLPGDLGAFVRHQLLQVGIGVKPRQRQVGQVIERFNQKVPAAAGVVEDFQVHEGAAVHVATGQRRRHGVVDAGLDQRLRQHRFGVVAGGGLTRVAGAFQEHLALFDADFAPCPETFFTAQVGRVVGVEVGLDGLALGRAAFVFKVNGVLGGALEAEFKQAFVNAAQVGNAHVLEVAPGVEQRAAPVRLVEQFFKQLTQHAIAEHLGLEQQRGARRVEQAAVEKRNVNVLGTLVEHFKQLLESVHAVVQTFALWRLPTQGLVNLAQAVALVERVLFQQGMVLVFKVHDEQQAKQQHHAVFIHAGQTGVRIGLVNGAAHDLEQRIFARIAVNHGLEVFLDRQREVG